MKIRKLLTPITAGFCLITFIVLTGCVTSPTSGKRFVDPALTQTAATDAALITGNALKAQYPEELRMTLESLDALVAVGGGSVDDLKGALSHLPVGFLEGTNGSVLIDGVAPVVSVGGQELVTLDKSEITKYYVLPIARGLRDGLRQALGAAPRSEAPKQQEQASVPRHDLSRVYAND